MRRIGIMIGSDSDLKQCLPGLLLLKEAVDKKMATVHAVYTNSIHRNTDKVLLHLRLNTRVEEIQPFDLVDVWIIGAGWANHLTGTADAYLRYHMKNDRVPVIGVAFESDDPDKTLAAILSIEAVPGTQVIFDRKRHVGKEGFMNACFDAVYAELPKMQIPAPKKTRIRILDDAIATAMQAIKK